MKVLFVSDLQLGAGADLGTGGEYGPGSRFADQEANLDRIVGIAETEQCGLVCVLGDVFERATPRPFEILAFQSFVRRLRNDGARVLCILGNHDVKSAALPSALEIFGEQGVVVALGPSLYPVDDVVVATLPWTPLSRLVAERPADDREGLHDLAAAALVESARVLGARATDEYPGAARILVGHWAVSGGALPTGLPVELLREPVLSLDGLSEAGFDLAVFGHIHVPAVLRGAPAVISCGSPMVHNWGEAAVKHGVWVYDSAAPSLRFVEVADRPFITLEPDADRLIDYPDEIEGVAVEGALVRVRYTATEEQAQRIDIAAIRRSLHACGAFKVVFRPTIVRAARARVEEMHEGLDETAAFELWLATQEETVPAERLREMHAGYLARLS